MADKVPGAAGNGPMLIRPSTWEALRRRVEGQGIVPDAEQFEIVRRGGKTFFRSKQGPAADGRQGGGAGSSPAAPWQPIFFTEGSGESLVYKCRFNLGTLNNVPATNWNDAFTLGMAEDTYDFVVITITSANGKVSGLTISVDSAPPETDEVSKDVPPISHKIVLGAIGRTSAQMIVDTNLNAVGVEVFRESKTAPAVGAEPYSRWWRWEHTSV